MGNTSDRLSEFNSVVFQSVEFTFILLPGSCREFLPERREFHTQEGNTLAEIVVKIARDDFAFSISGAKQALGDVPQFLFGAHKQLRRGLSLTLLFSP